MGTCHLVRTLKCAKRHYITTPFKSFIYICVMCMSLVVVKSQQHLNLNTKIFNTVTFSLHKGRLLLQYFQDGFKFLLTKCTVMKILEKNTLSRICNDTHTCHMLINHTWWMCGPITITDESAYYLVKRKPHIQRPYTFILELFGNSLTHFFSNILLIRGKLSSLYYGPDEWSLGNGPTGNYKKLCLVCYGRHDKNKSAVIPTTN